MNYMGVTVETPLFTGPVAVLLKLVTEKEVDIWELRIADIVEACSAELEKEEILNLEEATELLMVVSILIEIKSRWLLPNEEVEELEDLPDGAFDLLIARMLECKTFKAVSAEFDNMKREAARSWPRKYGLDQKFIEMMPDLLVNVDEFDLRSAYIKATTPTEVLEFNTRHLSPITRTMEETVEDVSAMLSNLGSATFKQITQSEDRIGVIFCFLAILELYKQGQVNITQANAFGEIQIIWVESATII